MEVENENESRNYSKNNTAHLLIGIILVILGLAVLGEIVNVVPWRMRDIIFSWQMILIALGVIFIAGRDSKSTGYILLTIGLFFLIPDLFHVPHWWRSLFWPFVLIVIGISIMFNKGRRPIGGDGFTHHHQHHNYQKRNSSEDYLDDVDVFGGSDRNNYSQNFQGGKVTHIFGGSKYDFRSAKLAEGTQYLEVVLIFGGTKIIVPEQWDTKVEVTSVFGGFSDKRQHSIVVKDTDRRLIIKGIAIFGGGEISNF